MSELRSERAALRLSQAEAAARMGVETGTWRKWESGSRKMSKAMSRLWARIALEVAAETGEAAKNIREGVPE